jgi:hypothetical protein
MAVSIASSKQPSPCWKHSNTLRQLALAKRLTQDLIGEGNIAASCSKKGRLPIVKNMIYSRSGGVTLAIQES